MLFIYSAGSFKERKNFEKIQQHHKQLEKHTSRQPALPDAVVLDVQPPPQSGSGILLRCRDRWRDRVSSPGFCSLWKVAAALCEPTTGSLFCRRSTAAGCAAARALCMSQGAAWIAMSSFQCAVPSVNESDSVFGRSDGRLIALDCCHSRRCSWLSFVTIGFLRFAAQQIKVESPCGGGKNGKGFLEWFKC